MSVAEAQSLPPFKDLPQKPPRIDVERRPDGSIVIRSLYDLGDVPRSMIHVFQERVAEHPDRKYICQRGLSGEWECITYAEMNARARAVAQALIARGFDETTPVMILSGNSIPHAVVAMGAMMARVPYAPVSAAYSIISQDFAKLRHVIEVAKPRMLFAEQGALYGRALQAVSAPGMEIVVFDNPPEGVKATLYSDLTATQPTPAVDTEIAKIDGETVAKYLFTSGSTGMPKGVIQVHRMFTAVVAGQQALRAEEEPEEESPESLEWMPWSHISAGNISFFGNIQAGGTQYLDAGKPIPGMFEPTIKNLKEIAPRVFGSAPIAFTMLAEAMERDPVLRKNFFKKLRFMGYGGATLSSDVYDRMQALAIKETGYRIPFTTMYGATETQGITVVHWITERVGLIGLPLPGVTLKLVPNGTKMEVRVKGPTVTPGYLNRPDLTAKAFDEEGFYALGDAAKFLNDNDPSQGIVFDGRVTEDFKLATGTWVSVGTLRAELIAALTPLVQDCVIAGLDKDDIRVLAWPVMAAAQEICDDPDASTPDEILSNAAVAKFVKERLAKHNKTASSSRRIKRLMLMLEPPSIDGHEITDKGYINQRATLDRRAKLVDLLYADELPSRTIEA